ncbi:MAG TPA: hybrid sensor histidine kinase/response regulator [Ktedonobacteraceae bacterium]|nr:hybrid sensor histidine kinase/response regulator [Ktedonobacteraceae bacterium]
MEKRAELLLQPIKPARLLVVDDDPALLQALSQMLALRLSDVCVDTAVSAQAAFEHIQTQDYDAVISDIKMPAMDGFDVLAAVQQVHPETPVLLITGHGEHDLATRALRQRAYDYILKPIDRDDLVASIQRAILTSQLRQQVKAQQDTLQQYASSLEQQVEQRTQELLAANAQLATASASREQMLSMVVHELAGPLTSLKGMVQLLYRQLQRDQATERLSQGFETIEGSLRRLERLIRDLHDVAHMQTQRFVLHPHACDVVDLCQHVLDEFTSGAGPTCEHRYYEGPLIVDVDAQRLSQVLLNLLSNARKYSADGACIMLTLGYKETEIIFTIEDRGVGIPAEALHRVYEQFYRVSSAQGQVRSARGLGLGLFIARAIVEQHGGRMEVQSSVGQGSTFSAILPGVRSHIPPLQNTTGNGWSPCVVWRLQEGSAH